MGRIFYLSTDILDCPDCHEMDKSEWVRQFEAAAKKQERNHVSEHIKHDRPPLRPKLRSDVLARDNYTCVYCGRSDVPLQCDHVFPWSRGGEDTMENLVAACEQCNLSKRDRTPEEWLGS
jgi:5-methylcytosine-specific restriction endonuclease McrA